MYDPDNLHSNLLSANWFLKAVLKYKLGSTTYFVQHAWYAVQFTNVQSTKYNTDNMDSNLFLVSIDFWSHYWSTSKEVQRILYNMHGTQYKVGGKKYKVQFRQNFFLAPIDFWRLKWKWHTTAHFTRLTRSTAFYTHSPPSVKYTIRFLVIYMVWNTNLVWKCWANKKVSSFSVCSTHTQSCILFSLPPSPPPPQFKNKWFLTPLGSHDVCSFLIKNIIL